MIKNWLTIKIWMENWGLEKYYEGLIKILENYNVYDLEIIYGIIKYMYEYKKELKL